jgi:hypothetical protein
MKPWKTSSAANKTRTACFPFRLHPENVWPWANITTGHVAKTGNRPDPAKPQKPQTKFDTPFPEMKKATGQAEGSRSPV